MSKDESTCLHELIIKSLAITTDIIGLFDKNDVVIYCNESFGQLFERTKDEATGCHFSQLIKDCYETNKGLHIETDDIDKWLDYAFSVRRVLPFRSFEADTCEGQWYRFTEQVIDESIFIYGTNITEAKNTEFALLEAQKELKAATITDALTGAFNRRFFNENVAAELDRAKRKHAASGLLLIDADNFKHVNDTFGHDAGDFVLQEITRRISAQLRIYDIFCRIGGEEFSIFLPETPITRSALIAQRCIDAINSQPFCFGMQSISVTVSIGISDTEDGTESLDQLYKGADNALLMAKRLGKNRFCYDRYLDSKPSVEASI